MKGGYNQHDWMTRYATVFEAIGYTPWQAEREAFNAWEASPDDADPLETAEADISYMAEDSK